MPKKPSLGPTIYRVELMSTGREYRPAIGVDDFTGLPIERVQEDRPIRQLPSAQELQDANNREKRKLQKLMLARVGITGKLTKPQGKPFKRRF